MRPRPRAARCALALVLAVPLGSAAAGCSDSGEEAVAPTASSTPAAVPLADRVLRGGEMTGFTAPPAETLDLAAIAQENDVTVAELRRRGVSRAAVTRLSGPPEAFGISAVAELANPAQARAEAARLIAANGSPEPGLAARPIAVPGIPGARGARKSGRREGREYVAFDVVWSDGRLAHELFVLARAGDVRQADVLAAATGIHDRTAAAPLPGS